MRYIFSCFLLCLTLTSYSQNYDLVDQKVETYPTSFKSVDLLAGQINKDFTVPQEKARAAFVWISKNVVYDLKILADNKSGIAFRYTSEKERVEKEKKFKNQIALQAVSENRAICHGYAALFELVCNKLGIEAVTVIGTLKSVPEQIGVHPGEINHAWNVIKIDGKWNFIDATLAAGDLQGDNFVKDYNDGFFLTSPEMFFLNHYPKDEKWKLVDKNRQDFALLPLYYREFFRKKLKMQLPSKGIITESGRLNMRLKDMGGGFLTYFLHNSYKAKVLEYDGNKSEYFIDIAVEQDDFFTLMANNKMIATYLVKTKS